MNEMTVDITPAVGECSKDYVEGIIAGAARFAQTCLPAPNGAASKIKVTIGASYPPLKITATISW